jgi:membrane fusion protein (multidrug efflux system)
VYLSAYNSAQANLSKAQAALEVARMTAARSAELVKIDAISTQDNENAIATFRQAEADVAANQAAVQNARLNLEYTHVNAPISGRIGKSSVTAGTLVTANQTTALATIQQLDPLYIDVTQSSSEWLQLKREIDAGYVRAGGNGTPTKIVLEDGHAYAHDGKLQFTDVTVDEATGSFLLRVLVPNPQDTLMPGMYVKALVSEGTLSKGILAPQQAVTRTPKGDAIALVVDQDGKVASRNIAVSRTIGDQWLVTDGLADGDRVIVEGLQKVHPGMPVQASERDATASSSQITQAAPAAGK